MKFNTLIGIDIEFTNEVENFCCYVETGMRATIIDVCNAPEDELYFIHFDFTKFEYHNRQLESLKHKVMGQYLRYRDIYGYDPIQEFLVSEAFDCFHPFPTPRISYHNYRFPL